MPHAPAAAILATWLKLLEADLQVRKTGPLVGSILVAHSISYHAAILEDPFG
jgi:predicted alpha/beta hydrolase family esterase